MICTPRTQQVAGRNESFYDAFGEDTLAELLQLEADSCLHKYRFYITKGETGTAVNVWWARDFNELVLISGSAGGGGGVDLYYDHDQVLANTIWTIPHNFGRYPSDIFIKDTAGSVLVGSRVDTSTNQTVLTFNVPVAGHAYLS